MVADRDRRNQVGVAADEGVVADRCVVLALAVIIAGDGAAAEVAVFADRRIANVGQVADRVADCEIGVLGFDIRPEVHARRRFGAGADMGEGADLVVFTQSAVVALACIDGGVCADRRILEQGVRPDHTAGLDDGRPAQDAAGQDRRAGRDDYFRIDVDIVADELHPVFKVALEGFGKLLLGSKVIFTRGRHGLAPFLLEIRKNKEKMKERGGSAFFPLRCSTKLPHPVYQKAREKESGFGFVIKQGRLRDRNFFELSAHYNLHLFWAECKRKSLNFRQFFGESIEHFFNKRLVIWILVCYNGLCKQPKVLGAHFAGWRFAPGRSARAGKIAKGAAGQRPRARRVWR